MNKLQRTISEKVITLYRQGLSMQRIAHELNVSYYTVRKILSESTKVLIRNNRVWTEEEDTFIRKNYKNMSLARIAEYLHRERHSISRRLTKLGLTLDYSHNIFKRWTKESSYLYGFIYADSSPCIRNRKGKMNYSLTFNLSDKDSSQLGLIKQILGVHNKISISENKGWGKWTARLYIGKSDIVKDLINLNIVPYRKEKGFLPILVPINLMSHFIRGFFDGDGSVYITINSCSRRKKKSYRLRLYASFSGQIKLLTWIKEKIKQCTNLNGFIVRDKRKNSWTLLYSSDKAEKFLDWIYNDSDNLRLERKFGIYKDWKMILKYLRGKWTFWENKQYGLPLFLDEVGTGSAAGPVFACACILFKGGKVIGLRDSKELSLKEREEFYPKVLKIVSEYSLGYVSSEEVKAMQNNYKAGALARQRAVEGIKSYYDCIISDYFDVPNVNVPVFHFPKADKIIGGVMCAALIAKIHRDNFMRNLSKKYPIYGWDHNYGYYCPQHITQVIKYGPSPHHRIHMPVLKRALKQRDLLITKNLLEEFKKIPYKESLNYLRKHNLA